MLIFLLFQLELKGPRNAEAGRKKGGGIMMQVFLTAKQQRRKNILTSHLLFISINFVSPLPKVYLINYLKLYNAFFTS